MRSLKTGRQSVRVRVVEERVISITPGPWLEDKESFLKIHILANVSHQMYLFALFLHFFSLAYKLHKLNIWLIHILAHIQVWCTGTYDSPLFESAGVDMEQTLGGRGNGPAFSGKRLPCRHPHRAGPVRRIGSSRSLLCMIKISLSVTYINNKYPMAIIYNRCHKARVSI